MHSEQEGIEHSVVTYSHAQAVIQNGTFKETSYHCSTGIARSLPLTHTHTQIGKWDLLIAHPPCTYISNAGVRHLYPGGNGILNEERLKKGIEATHFFLRFLYANCDRIAVENPIPTKVYCLPPYTQIIQPWMFGHPVQKKTCLWLKGLPPLMATEICEERQSSKVPGNWFNHGGKDRQKNRAKTFPGIAKAMAEQWG